jgi:hypothetical protein
MNLDTYRPRFASVTEEGTMLRQSVLRLPVY